MEIKVKSVKVIKTGTSEHGEWKMVGVTTDKSVKYVTFAKDADTIPPGASLNISDIDENEKGKSFRKFEIAQGVESTQTPAKDKAVARPEKPLFVDTRESSIEAQVAYKGIMENWEKDIPELMKLTAVRWGLSKLGVRDLPNYLYTAPEKPVVKEVVQPAPEKPALPIVESQDTTVTRPASMPPAIKTGAKLASYVGKYGIDLAMFNSLVQCAPNALESEAQLIAAWNVLAPKMKVK